MDENIDPAVRLEHFGGSPPYVLLHTEIARDVPGAVQHHDAVAQPGEFTDDRPADRAVSAGHHRDP